MAVETNNLSTSKRPSATSNNNHNEPDDNAQPRQRPKEDWFAWLQVLGAFCLNLNTWGMMNSYGAFQTLYQLNNLNTSSNISWIGSTQGFLLFFVSVFAGPLFDAGYLAALLWGGSVLVVVGMFLLSITSEYYQIFLTQAIMMGLGFGCLYLPAPAVVSQYFDKRTALAMGVSSAGSAIGGVVFPIALTHIKDSIDFGWSVRVLGFILLVTCLIPACVMKSQSPPRTGGALIDYAAFKDVPYILLCFGLMFGYMGLYIVFYYIELYTLDQTSANKSVAEYVLVILNIASLPGRVIAGYYADKIGSVNILTMLVLISTIMTACLLAIGTSAGVIVYCILYGFFSGAFMGLPAAGVINLTDDKSKIGARLGMTLGIVGLGVLISNPIAGAILGDENNWKGLVGWCCALLVAGTASMMASRIIKSGAGITRI